jgi:hypothetical protein
MSSDGPVLEACASSVVGPSGILLAIHSPPEMLPASRSGPAISHCLVQGNGTEAYCHLQKCRMGVIQLDKKRHYLGKRVLRSIPSHSDACSNCTYESGATIIDNRLLVLVDGRGQ